MSGIAELETSTATGRRKVVARGAVYTLGRIAAKPGVQSELQVHIGAYTLTMGAEDARRVGTQILSMGQDDALVQAGGTRTRRGVDNLASYPTQEELSAMRAELARLRAAMVQPEFTPEERKALELAGERMRNGWTWPKNDLELDESEAVSTGEHGVWVRAWVHVDRADLEENAQ